MQREIEPVGQDKYGHDVHPAFGMIGASRVTTTPGAALFQSDVLHGNFVRIRIAHATRDRGLHRDWVGTAGPGIVELDMSEAQWASFVSSMNVGDGVPCTIRRTEKDGQTPEFPHESRLAHTMRETREAADEAFGTILDALAALEALEQKEKPTAKERREALRALKNRIENAPKNVEFAGKQLAEHAEAVVQKACADIEAIVLAKAKQLKLESGDIVGLYELSGPANPDDARAIDQ